MTLIYYKSFAALLIFVVSIATVIYPLKKKAALTHVEPLELAEALASGIFLGAAFFHMLPDAIKMFSQTCGSYIFPVPEFVCVCGFLLLLFLERLSISSESIRTKNSVPYILAIILIIHAVIEGAALGIGATYSEALLIFIAILAHKGSESFSLCIALLRHELPLRRIIFIIVFFSLMTPLGIGLGTVINSYEFLRNGEIVAALFKAFAAGTFLYISTLHHIHFHHHADESQGMVEFACLTLGVAAMAAIALYT